MAATERTAARRFAALVGLLVAIILAGSLGLALAEGVSVPYGFLWTMDIIATLGTIPQPHDTAGRVIIVGLEVGGIGTLFYGLATIAEFFVSGQLTGLLERRRERRTIMAFHHHYIVAGYGRVGRQVARDLKARKHDVVAIDLNPAHREDAETDGILFIEGQPADDAILRQAGIEHAAAVIACVDSDAENIFVSLSARELRPDILIVARASAEDSEKKLLRAGADRVISPYKTTGTEMARIALHPQVGGAVDVADYRVEEIEVPPACTGIGLTVRQVRGSSVIVALRRRDGTFEPQPSPDAVVDVGDRLVTLGTPAALEQVESFFQPAGWGEIP
jgi:voltage-gated potassium channel